ncbi:hypothetical protein [Kineococcus aurantiacus]|uniref:Uncharacterized protein n=1 Tax=Kineococcus aurantiacus TaxID=37633 RepID=A0A7Y9J0W2_9ACTN|nr:hypothetical protein [Kineococcus aurantiacus]NYD22611.1 hypothetical protein [Kineococcus aurantiacus]
MRTSELKDAWRRSVRKRRDEDARAQPLDLTTDPHTPTRGTRGWMAAAISFGLATVAVMRLNRGDDVVPGWVIGSSAGVTVLCLGVWALLYRRVKTKGQVPVRPSS